MAAKNIQWVTGFLFVQIFLVCTGNTLFITMFNVLFYPYVGTYGNCRWRVNNFLVFRFQNIILFYILSKTQQ